MDENQNANLTEEEKFKQVKQKIKSDLYGNCNRNPKDVLFDIYSTLTDAERIDSEMGSLIFFLHHFFQDIELLELNK